MKNKNKLTTLGEAIEHYMLRENMSWYKLAILSGVCQGTLSKIKHKGVSPTLYTMERIARALNVNLSDIITKKELIEGLL